jgi:hypothetical protein
VHLGFGRREGRVAGGVGFNSYVLRSADNPYTATGTVTKADGVIYDICVTKVNSIEHRGEFAQQDLNHKEYDKEGTYSLPGHEATRRWSARSFATPRWKR